MKNLFVGNLSFNTTENELRSLFEPMGQITRIHIATDRETGRSRGFAFVEMSNDEEAARAITALDGKDFDGRNIKVNEARPRAESGGPRSSSGGRGGFGHGRSRYEGYRDVPLEKREPRW
ncbi:MAG TPA: RNA-binding protein [Candidatus Dormibacteraeota bacterium]|nr:RNA-binding protein [Candidatus Dormibacteraeota bacterium]